MSSIKLSVTLKNRLARKYSAASLSTIDIAIAQWIAADKARGIDTIHIALDEPVAMGTYGLPPVTGRVSANKVKRAIDGLWKRLQPDYLVLFGAQDVIPYFSVANPSFAPSGDTDEVVPTDNPYATDKPFRARDRASYLVPSRACGRISDMLGSGDPAWLVDYLARATAYSPQPGDYFANAYTRVF